MIGAAAVAAVTAAVAAAAVVAAAADGSSPGGLLVVQRCLPAALVPALQGGNRPGAVAAGFAHVHLYYPRLCRC